MTSDGSIGAAEMLSKTKGDIVVDVRGKVAYTNKETIQGLW